MVFTGLLYHFAPQPEKAGDGKIFAAQGLTNRPAGHIIQHIQRMPLDHTDKPMSERSSLTQSLPKRAGDGGSTVGAGR